MYQTDFMCTYKLMEESDILSDDEDDDCTMDNKKYANMLYQMQLLQAFNLNVWKDDIIDKELKHLYSLCENNTQFKELFHLINLAYTLDPHKIQELTKNTNSNDKSNGNITNFKFFGFIQCSLNTYIYFHLFGSY